jgi:hypothetical protein
MQSYIYLFTMWPVYFPNTLSRSKLFSSLSDSRWQTKGCTAAENSSYSDGPCSIKPLHPSPEHRIRSKSPSIVLFFLSFFSVLIPDEKVLKKMNVRCNRNLLQSQPVRIHSTSCFFTKIVAHFSRCLCKHGYSRFPHTQHSRMETFNYCIAWQCNIM